MSVPRPHRLLALLLFLPASLAAQLPRITVPEGAFRIEFGGVWTNASSRYNDGVTEDLARSLTTRSIGGDYFPALRAAEDAIAGITGRPGYRLDVGALSVNGLVNRVEGRIGLAWGLTSRLTIGATLPVVRTRVQVAPVFDSTGADAGFNPGSASFLPDLDAALATLEARLANGDYNGDPALQALAVATLQSGQGLRNDLGAIFSNPASPFVPTTASDVGMALADSVATFQATLAGPLGVTDFSTAPPLAPGRIGLADFQNFLSGPGSVGGDPLTETEISRPGDLELNLAYGLVDRWNRPDHPGGLRIAAELLGRLPTSYLDRPENFVDVGTGDHVFAVGARATVDLGRGKIGARLTGEHLLRLSRTAIRRVALPSEPIPYANRQVSVKQDLGDITSLSVQPFFRLGPTLAIQAGVQYWKRGDDATTYASDSDSIPDVSASALDVATGASMLRFIAGMRYATPAVETGAAGLPIEADWIIEGPLSGSGGIVWKERIVRVRLRFYGRL